MSPVEFLRTMLPEGPWLLAAVAVDRKGFQARTFNPTQINAVNEWIDTLNGKWNLYWHVNPVRDPINRKAERVDIKEVRYLHVDVDPRKGMPLEEEKKRIFNLRPAGVPQPSVIVSSGGGFQFFWKLKEPIALDGTLAAAEEAARYNRQLEILYGGDSCHNIDRLCRLPGTMNIPDAKKKKAGREACLAEVMYTGPEVYDISEFVRAPDIAEGTDIMGGGTQISVPANVPRLSNIDDLNEWGVPDRIKVIIVQGSDELSPKVGDNSRSAWLFDVVCALVKHKVPDDVIFGIITSPEYSISSSVLEKGDKYALRQIARAKEFTVSPHLMMMNERHAVIGNMGGVCLVLEETYSEELDRSSIEYQSFEAIRNRYSNKRVEVGFDKNGKAQSMPLGHWWLANESRRQYDGVVFSPEREVPGKFNLWRGFSVPPIKGDCGAFIRHIEDNICSGDRELSEYVLNWMAAAVQHPARPGETAIVLRGDRGTGKGMFARIFGSLFGRHFVAVTNAAHLVGKFNAHLEDCIVLFADEAFFAGDKQNESSLKTLITEPTLMVERKQVNAVVRPNYTHVIMASNSNWVVPVGAHERRYCVIDVGSDKRQDNNYFRDLMTQMGGGAGKSALLWELMNRDIKGFVPGRLPRTMALMDQMLLTLPPAEEWWYSKLQDGQVIPGVEFGQAVSTGAVYEDLMRTLAVQRIGHPPSCIQMGKMLSRFCPDLRRTQTWNGARRDYSYVFPSLETCRAQWDKLHGTRVPWQQIESALTQTELL